MEFIENLTNREMTFALCSEAELVCIEHGYCRLWYNVCVSYVVTYDQFVLCGQLD